MLTTLSVVPSISVAPAAWYVAPSRAESPDPAPSVGTANSTKASDKPTRHLALRFMSSSPLVCTEDIPPPPCLCGTGAECYSEGRSGPCDGCLIAACILPEEV